MNRRSFLKACGVGVVAPLGLVGKAVEEEPVSDKYAENLARLISMTLSKHPTTHGKFYPGYPSKDKASFIALAKNGRMLVLRISDLRCHRGRHMIKYMISEVKKQTGIYYHA